MPCYGPLTAYRPKADSGDKRLVFDKRRSETGVAIQIPCGKCSGCRLEHSRQWAVRCMHEKRMHSASAFVTLTYDNDHLPKGATLVKKDLQNFMKRFRNVAGEGVRFFACGEYGERSLRPHYHLLLLNRDFGDKRVVTRGSEYNLYSSKVLSDLWTAGNHVIGDVTFESCAYTARYCMKKINGPKAAAHYAGREPEFIVMSRRPGLGAGYFDKYAQEIVDHDTIIVNSKPAALPRYYDGRLPSVLPENLGLHTAMELVKLRRRCKITMAMRRDNSLRRLHIRETVALAKLRLKGRVL